MTSTRSHPPRYSYPIVAPANATLLTRQQVAAYLQVSQRLVWDLTHKGYLQSLRVGGARRWRRCDVEALIAGSLTSTSRPVSPTANMKLDLEVSVENLAAAAERPVADPEDGEHGARGAALNEPPPTRPPPTQAAPSLDALPRKANP